MSKIYLKYQNIYQELIKAGKKNNGNWEKGEIINIYQKSGGSWMVI